MAIEKTLNTRIQLKYDLYENWLSNNPTPLKGEVCIATIPSNQDGVVNAPATLIKIGDGTSDYKTLKFLSATAADVSAWAKEANKPSYEASEITGIDAYIADYVNDQMGISVDTDTQYQLVKVDDYNYKLQSKGKTDETWADVTDSVITIPQYDDTDVKADIQTNADAIAVLNGDAEGSVAKAIADAITALNLAETYAAKTHTHAIADVTGLSEAITTAEENAVDRVLGYLADEEVNVNYDTLKEVAAWIEADTTASAELITRVSNIEKDYLNDADKTELQGNIDAVSTVANAAATQTALEDEVTRAITRENEIEAKADSALQEITTTENGGLKVTNNNQIDIDDTVTFIFDCGTSEV